MHSRLVLVTGAQAAGKTTIARAMAERLDRAVHIDGDVIHGFVAAGEVPFDLPPPPGAMEQLYLRYRGSLAVAREYLEAGFDAIISDNMFGQQLTDVVGLAATLTDLVHVIVLDPSESTIAEREAERDKVGYSDTITPAMLIAAVRTETPRLGLWHDSGGESVNQTVRTLIDNLDAARVVVADTGGSSTDDLFSHDQLTLHLGQCGDAGESIDNYGRDPRCSRRRMSARRGDPTYLPPSPIGALTALRGICLD